MYIYIYIYICIYIVLYSDVLEECKFRLLKSSNTSAYRPKPINAEKVL